MIKSISFSRKKNLNRAVMGLALLLAFAVDVNLPKKADSGKATSLNPQAAQMLSKFGPEATERVEKFVEAQIPAPVSLFPSAEAGVVCIEPVDNGACIIMCCGEYAGGIQNVVCKSYGYCT